MFNLHTIWTKQYKKKKPYIFPNDQKVYVISYLYFSKKNTYWFSAQCFEPVSKC